MNVIVDADAAARAGWTPLDLTRAFLDGGARFLQLRAKSMGGAQFAETATAVVELAHSAGAVAIVNDRADIAVLAGADGVHVGQDDMPAAEARRLAGDDVLLGLSTHSPEQLDAALAAGDADQLSVGPVWETPTKEGRPAAGLDYVRHAARVAGERPWFAIGGIDLDNVSEVIAAGASRVVVVRAIRNADDPRPAAAALRAALEEADVGAEP